MSHISVSKKNSISMFKGAFTALALPFLHGEIDEESYRSFIEWQIESGINGFVPCGSTGESATLTHEEHDRVLRICIEQVNKRVPVIAGCGSNNTKEAIALVEFAKKAGADAAMLISPYYNKPSQEGIFQHYKSVNNAVSIPLLAYNVPSRTSSNIEPKTMARMYAQLPDMIGVKEASADLAQVSNIVELTTEALGESCLLFIGDDHTLLPSLAIGAHGSISVTSNIVPRELVDLCNAWDKGDLLEAKRLHYLLEPLNRGMFIDSNPVPVKTALYKMNKFKSDEVRLPLYKLQEETDEKITQLLKKYNLI